MFLGVVQNQVRLFSSLLLASTLILLASCSNDCPGDKRPVRSDILVSVNEGVWGDVWFWEGDFMPDCASGSVSPVSREVVVFKLTMPKDVTVSSEGRTFYVEVLTEEVARTNSNARGFYEFSLPPGEYSIFVVENSKFYANRFGGSGEISPFTVKTGSVTDVRMDINYLSSW